uniref:chloride channel protein C-like n=1 Tax=Ciona intestinalis TaxID=7719 RepID=UPI000521B917|nr:chloride channel protein C-like [Ciona intestinalis]|eukprot:XP_009858717.1 chloride channel protein C-like [Ciona intestinalis]
MNEGGDVSGRETENGIVAEDLPKLSFHCYDYDTTDDSHLADTENSGFFSKGREYESAFVNHKYTNKEREELQKYDSLDYLPPWSTSYKNWVREQPRRLDWDRWVMMGLIGFSVGIVGFLLHQLIDLISDTKWFYATQYLQDSLAIAWVFAVGYSLIFLIPAAAIVVWLRPSAGGSGIPELIGFLNGTIIRHIFNIRTMVVKFISCVFAVGSGMPVGPEGPMIHLGGLIGAGLSQFKSDSFGIRPTYFQRFRNSEDRRNFISAGAAAGVSSAFGAPVGGLLFSMEEVSSFWNMKLSWQTFFCCMISTFTTDLFNSAFNGFTYTGSFGLFATETNIMFQVDTDLATNILAFIPSAILGCIGGILGALFTFLNVKIARLRRRLLSKIKSQQNQKVVRFLEPCIIMILTATVSVLLPAGFTCTKYECNIEAIQKDPRHDGPQCLTVAMEDYRAPRTEPDVERYVCPVGLSFIDGNKTLNNQSYNEAATLLFVTGEQAIKHLFSNGTHRQFQVGVLITVLVIYYVLACWAAGTSISSGLVVPMLFIGALYGRIVGQLMVTWFGIHPPETDPYYAWMDPGAMALIGAASFFGGVSRLTMSLTVIMVEITNDISFLLPMMSTIMISKWVGDYFTHPLYHSLLEFKCIPFLDSEPVVYSKEKKLLNLELYCAGDAMTKNTVVVHPVEKVGRLCKLLLSTTHGGFPVIKDTSQGPVLCGLITRLELCMLLQHNEIFVDSPDGSTAGQALHYQTIHVDRLLRSKETYKRIENIFKHETEREQYLDLSPYYNQSCVSLPETFSLHRTYIIFRTLGLRHLPVVDDHNHVVGIITRKDLMGFKLEETLHTKLTENSSDV